MNAYVQVVRPTAKALCARKATVQSFNLALRPARHPRKHMFYYAIPHTASSQLNVLLYFAILNDWLICSFYFAFLRRLLTCCFCHLLLIGHLPLADINWLPKYLCVRSTRHNPIFNWKSSRQTECAAWEADDWRPKASTHAHEPPLSGRSYASTHFSSSTPTIIEYYINICMMYPCLCNAFFWNFQYDWVFN